MRRLVAIAALMIGCDSEPLGTARARIESPTDAGNLASVVAIVGHDATCAPAPPPLVCTGTLIAKDVVLTAAHCFKDLPPTTLDVVANGAMVRVRGGAKHPEYDGSFAHDVAVLFLERAVGEPIALRRDAFPTSRIGEQLVIAGYGGVEAKQEVGTVRLDAINADNLRVVPLPSMTCRGDSGGPLFAREGEALQLIGVTTHGDPACRVEGFAARVDRHLAFIDEALAAPPPAARTPFDPSADFCAQRCTTDGDCGEGLACIEQHCSFAGLPAGRFGATCTTTCAGDSPCVRVSSSACRCLEPCTPNEVPTDPSAKPSPEIAGAGGCSASRAGSSYWFVFSLLLFARRRR